MKDQGQVQKGVDRGGGADAGVGDKILKEGGTRVTYMRELKVRVLQKVGGGEELLRHGQVQKGGGHDGGEIVEPIAGEY